MTETWITVLVVGVGTISLKAAGTLVFGTRPLPSPLMRVVRLLGPALLAGLIVVQTVAGGSQVVVDARIVGVGAAVAALALRAPVLVAVVLAAAVAAVARLVGMAA